MIALTNVPIDSNYKCDYKMSYISLTLQRDEGMWEVVLIHIQNYASRLHLHSKIWCCT